MAHSLDQWMRENDTTDAALATKVGVSRPHLTKIRLGQRQPSLPVAAKLAEETKLPVTSFLTPTVSSEPDQLRQGEGLPDLRPDVAFHRTSKMNGAADDQGA